MKYYHQILFVLVFSIITYTALKENKDPDANIKNGVKAALFIIIAQGFLKQYEGPFNKGTTTFWKGVQRFVLVYLVAITFILYQNPKDARQLMKHVHPELGKPVTKDMHTYEENCDFEWANLWDNFDHYFLIHVINWFCAALIVRDYYILHFWSIFDEIIELSWQHILPHFGECWWDHVILDILLSNTTAIIIGVELTKLLGWEQFDWLGRRGKKSILQWDVFRCHRRLGGLIIMIVIITANFLTGFFMINGLWIPPVNWINIYRLLVWFLLAAITFAEMWDDIKTWGKETRKKLKITSEFRWTCIAVAYTEVLVSWKFRKDAGNTLDTPTPMYKWLPWLIGTSFVGLIYIKLRFGSRVTTQYGDSEWERSEKKSRDEFAEEPPQKSKEKKKAKKE